MLFCLRKWRSARFRHPRTDAEFALFHSALLKGNDLQLPGAESEDISSVYYQEQFGDREWKPWKRWKNKERFHFFTATVLSMN
jgi:hypothetical protein